jgi:hypothetical protein
MKRTKKQIVKMNLSLDRDFYVLLQEKARADYMRVSTWTKQLLMRSLLDKNNDESNCLTQNGNRMELQ